MAEKCIQLTTGEILRESKFKAVLLPVCQQDSTVMQHWAVWLIVLHRKDDTNAHLCFISSLYAVRLHYIDFYLPFHIH